MKPNDRHIYGTFGFLIITFERTVWLRNDFTGVILTHVDTFQPIFSKIRTIIKQPIVVDAPAPPPIISKLSCSWPITNHKPIKTQTIPDTISDCSIEIHTGLSIPSDFWFMGGVKRPQCLMLVSNAMLLARPNIKGSALPPSLWCLKPA